VLWFVEPAQGGHPPGKPEKIWQFGSGQRKCQKVGNVWETVFLFEVKWLKLIRDRDITPLGMQYVYHDSLVNIAVILVVHM